MKILYFDDNMIVCIKPAGVLSTDEAGGMPDLIRACLNREMPVFPVHRLDSVVAGIMVYALTKEAASDLGRQMNDEKGAFSKEYMAVLEGKPQKDQDELRDLLVRDRVKRRTYVVRKREKEAQEAILRYRILEKEQSLSLVRIKLVTGRTHQIRAQFSSRHLPLYGDGKYGAQHKDTGIALWSCHLAFCHPVTGKRMDFTAMPPNRKPWTSFPGYIEEYEQEDIAAEFHRNPALSDCSYGDVCGGCSYQGVSYEKQLEKKQKLVNKWLRKFGTISPIIGTDQPLGYRQKNVFVCWPGNDGRLLTGMYGKRGHQPVPISHCPIAANIADEIIGTIRRLMSEHQILPYDAKTGKGWLRQIQVRSSSAGGRVLVVLTAVADGFEAEADFVRNLTEAHPEVESIVLCLVPANKPAGASGKERILYGSGSIEDTICGMQYQVSPRSFFPVNPLQTERIYRQALEYASLEGGERIFDLYCGPGILGSMAASVAGKVLMVEGHPQAAREAAAYVRQKHIENVRLVTSEPEAYVISLARSHEHFDQVFLTLQGNGDGRKAAEATAALHPEKIICISGEPETLSANLDLLVHAGYRVDAMQPFDELPYTGQVTTVCLLSPESEGKESDLADSEKM